MYIAMSEETKIQKSIEFISKKLDLSPQIAMITGTGFSNITKIIEVVTKIPYEEIPNFPVPTVKSHTGMLVFGKVKDKTIVAMEGRIHLYEGYNPKDIAFVIRVMAGLGAKYLLITSAVGGIDPFLETGDFVLINDHINFTGTNPLIGKNIDSIGIRFPDMSSAYPAHLRKLAIQAAIKKGIRLKEGIYAGVLGPCLETPAETRFLRIAGGHVVGMSTVQEVITAVHCGVQVLAIGVVTNVNSPDCMAPSVIEDIISVAENTSDILSVLWKSIIAELQ